MAANGWKRAARQRRFLAGLGRHGDAALAAAEAGVGLEVVQGWRAADAKFAHDWLLAMRTPWERVEAGVLKRLLEAEADPATLAKLLDSRGVLTLMAQRMSGREAAAVSLDVESAGAGSAGDVARVRAEIAALGGQA